MRREEFLSTKELQENVDNRKNGIDGKAVNWLKIRWLRLVKEKPSCIYFKHSFDKESPFRVLDLKQRAPTKPRKNSKRQTGLYLQSLAEVQQSPLYPHRRPVTKAKKQDMQSLLTFIPSIHHQFYKDLPLEVATRRRIVENEDDELDEDNDEVLYL